MWTDDSIENRYRFAFGRSNERNKSTKKKPEAKEKRERDRERKHIQTKLEKHFTKYPVALHVKHLTQAEISKYFDESNGKFHFIFFIRLCMFS